MGIFSRDDSSAVNPAQSLPYTAHRPLTAAAQQVRVGDKGEFEQFKSRRSANSSSWQEEAWEYYDAIGEIKLSLIHI